jgi:hypothetical protein
LIDQRDLLAGGNLITLVYKVRHPTSTLTYRIIGNLIADSVNTKKSFPIPPINCLFVIREVPIKDHTNICFTYALFQARLVVGKLAENEVERDVCL